MATVKQRIAFNEVVKGSTLVAAMKKAKYAPSTSKRTNKLTATDGWKELMDTFISDDDLARRHSEQLNSFKHSKLYFDMDDSDEMIEEVCEKLGVELLYVKENKDKTGKTANVRAPDLFFRDLAIDKGYKIKGRYSEEKGDNNKTLIVILPEQATNRYGVRISSNSSNGS